VTKQSLEISAKNGNFSPPEAEGGGEGRKKRRKRRRKRGEIMR